MIYNLMNTVEDNLQTIRQRICTVANKYERDPKSIALIAVSKTKPCQLIEQAIIAGQHHFGENYVQEGVEKVSYFKETQPTTPLIWHFIGPLQSNKSKLVAEHFDWIHTIDRAKIAKRLSEQRPSHLPKLNVLIQVNISDEASKSGISPEQILPLANMIEILPNLQLRGLMTIPKPNADFAQQVAELDKMFKLYRNLADHVAGIDTLSMGMSDDMEAAIKAGSTMVRIGRAIFGARQYN